MANPVVWAGVAVNMQSAIATPLAISAISKANPGVVSYTGADPVNGNFVVLSIQGMYEVNEFIARIASVDGAANTFALDSIDTTLFHDFASGTAAVVTLGTSITTFTTVNGSGGDAAEIDATTIHDQVDKIELGNFSAIKYTFGSQWDPADAGFKAMVAASKVKARRAFQFLWPDGRMALVYGRIGFAGTPGGQTKAIVESPATITSQGFPNFYAS
jgi:hypothetical protein